ncbi:hypothetical protein MLD63_07780 [Paracoccus sp. TK19116]|uniref:Uncharacterized protein n=1 Tax=Paracoccus albicereus TaxID=2922394 RepID=A0ABT1MTY9_9RHOB|nr:hypothetical protein [Paracoccus albicereus]MCQ0970321.1 hypothetical protein [Paracoccus albicereus]
MGFEVTLLLIAADNADRVLKAAGLQDTGDLDEYSEAPFSGATLDRHYLIWANWDDDMMSEEDFARLSRTAPILTCDVSESSAFSACRAWRDGRMAWGIWHDGSTGGDVDFAGDLPASAAALIERYRATQAAETDNVDHLFEIPVALFVDQGGLHYGDDHGLPFTELAREGGP